MAQPLSTPVGAPAMQRGAWLDFMRLAVACLLVLYHFHLAGPVSLETFHPVFGRGYLLTDFFLLDSGYVLARIYATRVGTKMTYGEFVQKRFLRIVPGHVVMIGVLVALVLVAGAVGVAPTHGQYFDWEQLPAQLFLVQAYGVPGGKGWNVPTWSISALLGCYLLFPFVARRLWRMTAWKALGLGVGLFLVMDVLSNIFLGLPVYRLPMQYGIIRAVPLFLYGVALARFSEAFYIQPRLAKALGLGALLLLTLFELFSPNGLVAMGLIGVMVVASGAIPIAKPSRIVATGAMAAYAIFITNEVVRIGYFGVAEVLINRFHLSVGVQWVLWAGGLVAALVFALVFYKVFDAPTQAWFNRKKKPRQAAQQVGGLAPAEPPAT